MISSLHIINFKCFEDIVLPMRPLTLLSGVNGTGKSTVLQALLLLRQSTIENPLRFGPLNFNGDWTKIGAPSDATYYLSTNDFIQFDLNCESGDILRLPFIKKDSQFELSNAEHPDPDRLFRIHLFSDAFQYLNAERKGPRTVFPMSDEDVRKYRLGIRGEFTSHFLAVRGDEKLDVKTLIHPEAEGESLRHQAEAWLDFVCPGTRLKTTMIPSMNAVRLRYQFTAGRDLTNEMEPNNTGFGLTYTLPLIVGVLSAKAGALLLLENPEAHLHPIAQARMGEFLAKAAGAGIQIILETHSDHILNGIRLAVREGDIPPEQVQLHFFRRAIVYDQEQLIDKPNHTCVSPKLDHNGRMDQRPDGFFDEWDKSLRRMLQPAAKNK